MHAISRTYGIFSVLVPLFGFAVMFTSWSWYIKSGALHASILLSVIAWALLYVLIIPRQRVMLAGIGVADSDEAADDASFQKRVAAAEKTDYTKQKKQLAMFSGIFALLWFVVAILMFFV